MTIESMDGREALRDSTTEHKLDYLSPYEPTSITSATACRFRPSPRSTVAVCMAVEAALLVCRCMQQVHRDAVKRVHAISRESEVGKGRYAWIERTLPSIYFRV